MRLSRLDIGLLAAGLVIWVGLCALRPKDDLASLEEFIGSDNTRYFYIDGNRSAPAIERNLHLNGISFNALKGQMLKISPPTATSKWVDRTAKTGEITIYGPTRITFGCFLNEPYRDLEKVSGPILLRETRPISGREVFWARLTNYLRDPFASR